MIDLPTPPLPETMVIIRPSRRRAPSAGGGAAVGGLARRLRRTLARLERVDPMDRGDQVVAGERLLEHLARAGEHRAPEELAPALHRHEDDAGLGRVLGEHLGRLHPVEAGQAGIEDGDVGNEMQRLLERVLAVRGGAADGDVLLGGRDGAAGWRECARCRRRSGRESRRHLTSGPG